MEKTINFTKLIPDSCRVLQIECTRNAHILLTTSGYVYTWGELSYALGRKLLIEADRLRPMRIDTLKDVKISNIACGDNHVLALSSQGTIYSWGENDYGQLGLGNTEPVSEPQEISLKKVIRISAGNEYSFALIEKVFDGNTTYVTYVWGRNENIKLRKINDEDQMKSMNPVKVLQPAWGDYHPNVTVKPNKRGKNYAYKSILGNDVQLGNLSKDDITNIDTENLHLKRKLQIFTKKIIFYEEKVYGCDISLRTGGLENDKILENIKKVLNKTKEIRKGCSDDIIILSNDLLASNKTIEEKDEEIRSKLIEEQLLRENIDKCEDEIKYLMIKFENAFIESGELSHISALKHELLKHSELYAKLCEEKARLQKDILERIEISRKISEDIKEKKDLQNDAFNTIKIFTAIKKIRKQQLFFNFFEQCQ